APAFDLAPATPQPVGRRARDQLLAGAPPLLGGEEQGAVLHERSLVDEVGQVLARRAPALLVATRNRLRACCVQADGMSLANRAQVRSHPRRLAARGRRPVAGRERLGVGGEGEQRLALL